MDPAQLAATLKEYRTMTGPDYAGTAPDDATRYHDAIAAARALLAAERTYLRTMREMPLEPRDTYDATLRHAYNNIRQATDDLENALDAIEEL